MNKRGISTTATSISIGLISAVFIIGGFFIYKYLGQDPIERSVIQTLKIEYSISKDTHTVTILESDENYFKGIVTSKGDGTTRTIVGKYENGVSTLFYFNNERPTCELISIHNVPKNILGNCKIFNGIAYTVDDAKSKLNDQIDESFSIIGFITFSDDPSNGQVGITSGDDTILIQIKDKEDVSDMNNNEVVVVDITENNGNIEVDSIKNVQDDDEDSVNDNEDNQTINEPNTEFPPEYYYNIYDLNEAELLKLLND